MAGHPVKRGLIGSLVDRLGGWTANLSPESSSYSVLPVKIPIEGGAELAADVYQPITRNNNTPAAGSLLVQGPYGRSLPLSLSLARVWAARGYNVLLVSTRGTFGSAGSFVPAARESADGPWVVRWMRRQPWYTGSFATFGMSYLGYTQWALMASEEPLDDHAAAVILVGLQDFGDLAWGTGAFWLPGIDWAEASAVIESQGPLRRIYTMATASPNGDIATKRTVPLLDGAKKAVGADSQTYEWLHTWLTGSEGQVKGPGATGYWKSVNQVKGVENAKVPILLVGGWQDVFAKTTVDQYHRLRERGCADVALTMGPWEHMGSASDLKDVEYWFGKYLAKKGTGEDRQAAAKINVTGSNEWKWFHAWPPATRPFELYLDSPGRLAKAVPAKTDTAQFTFDPHDPTPTFGGPLLLKGGYVDDSALAKRPDVLSFTTPPLDEAVEIHGRPRVELLHSSDNPHVDLFVRLSDVNRKGVSRNICEAYRRVDPGRAPAGQPVRIELDLSDCAHHFKKGTAVRLLVAGGNFPLYSYNLGSGEEQATGTTLRPARHTVHTGGNGGSKFVLPVLAA